MGLRLLLAALYGGAIGYERRQAEKPAGIRTLSLVSAGSALFTLTSIFGFGAGEPARVAAQIVTGIGFLGAGIIFQSGTDVRGLTTAASVWITAAVGMSVATGMYAVSALTVLLAILILHFFPRRV